MAGSLLTLPEYRRFYAAALASRTANEMSAVSIVLLVLDRGGGHAAAGAAAGAVLLPSLVTGPLVGTWLDRVARPIRLATLEPAVACCGFALLAALAGNVPTGLTLLVAIATGALLPLSTGGLTSLISGIAPAGHVDRAFALEGASFNTAIVAGPLLAGTAAAIAGPAAAVSIQAVLKAVAATRLALMTPVGRSAPRPRESFKESTWRGLREVGGSRPLRAVTVAGAVALMGRGLLAVGFPAFAVATLDEPASFAGFLWGAYAAGSLVGSLGYASFARRRTPEWVVMHGVLLAAAPMAVWAIVATPAMALVLAMLAGGLYGPALVATFAVRESESAPDLRGNVFATGASIKTGSYAAGAAASGPIVAAAGVDATLLLAAGVHVVAFVTGAVMLRAGQAERSGSPSTLANSSGSGRRSQTRHAP